MGLPWTLEIHERQGEAVLRAPDGYCIASFDFGEFGSFELGNARFIHRACNAHDDLVDTCLAMEQIYTSWLSDDHLDCATLCEMVAKLQPQLQAALAKAKGQP